MKRTAIIVSAVAAALLMNVSAVFSAEEYMGQGMEQQQTQQKDECLLVAQNCPGEVMSIQQKINKLNAEIAKGTDVYTVDELRILNDKLDDAYKTLEDIQQEGH